MLSPPFSIHMNHFPSGVMTPSWSWYIIYRNMLTYGGWHTSGMDRGDDTHGFYLVIG